MSTSSNHIVWNNGIVEIFLAAINYQKWSSSQWKELEGRGIDLLQDNATFIDIYRSNEDTSIGRLNDKYYEKQKRVCQTMSWKDYNQENLSAYDGDLG